MIFSHWLETGIEPGEQEGLSRNLIIDSVRRGRLLAYFSIAFELLFSIFDISASALKVDGRFQFGAYLAMYLAMIAMSVAFLLLTADRSSLKIAPFSVIRSYERGIVLYVTLVMVWGSVLTLMDQRLYGQLVVFMTNMIACSVIFFLDNRKILIPYSISTAIVYIGLPFFQSSSDLLIGHYVNLSFFIFISWVSSRLVYLSYCSDYKSRLLLHRSNTLLEAEIQHNRITNQRLAEANAHLKSLALVDELTGLPNRRSFRDFIDLACESPKEPLFFSVIMIDIDDFKLYNDTHGHSGGDEVLRCVAGQINELAGETGGFGVRWGGEEFLYATFQAKAGEITAIAETLRLRVEELCIPHEQSSTGLNLTISLGTAALAIADRGDISRCIEKADKALYEAKTAGRNCVRGMK